MTSLTVHADGAIVVDSPTPFRPCYADVDGRTGVPTSQPTLAPTLMLSHNEDFIVRGWAKVFHIAYIWTNILQF